MTMLGRGKRQAQTQANKAEKARKRAAEAARRAKEAEEEAAEALREAEEAEAEAESDEPGEPDEPESKAATETVTEPESDEESGDEPGEEPGEGATAEADVESGTVPSKAKLRKTAAKDDEDDEPAGRTRTRRRRWVPPLGPRSYTLIVVDLVLLGVLAWLLVAVQGLKADERAVQQVTFAAKQAAEDLSSYDYRTIDADLKRATGHTTGKFRNDFARLTGSVRPSALQRQAVVEGTAVRTSVESVDGRKAIALVYLNQATAVASTAQRTPNSYTLRLVMTKVGDRWMVSDLQMI